MRIKTEPFEGKPRDGVTVREVWRKGKRRLAYVQNPERNVTRPIESDWPLVGLALLFVCLAALAAISGVGLFHTGEMIAGGW